MILRQEARKAVGTHNNTPINIIPDSNAAPVLTGEMANITTANGGIVYSYQAYRRAHGAVSYSPSTLLVTVGQHWLSPVVEAIADDYKYDA
jgi:hypothetical protein